MIFQSVYSDVQKSLNLLLHNQTYVKSPQGFLQSHSNNSGFSNLLFHFFIGFDLSSKNICKECIWHSLLASAERYTFLFLGHGQERSGVLPTTPDVWNILL